LALIEAAAAFNGAILQSPSSKLSISASLAGLIFVSFAFNVGVGGLGDSDFFSLLNMRFVLDFLFVSWAPPGPTTTSDVVESSSFPEMSTRRLDFERGKANDFRRFDSDSTRAAAGLVPRLPGPLPVSETLVDAFVDIGMRNSIASDARRFFSGFVGGRRSL
jgi:hypothetical protein